MCCPREIIPSRGDNLHYPPIRHAITVLLYRTSYNKWQTHKTRDDLNVLTRCQLDTLPFVARLCFISVVFVGTCVFVSVCWHNATVELLHCVRTDVHCCALLYRTFYNKGKNHKTRPELISIF